MVDYDSLDYHQKRFKPSELGWIDPHQKLLLNCSEEALADGAIDIKEQQDVGVYIAASQSSYLESVLRQLESAEILEDIGFSEVSLDEMRLVNAAWRGVWHRPDSAALFFGAFSLAGDQNPSRLKRLASNFVRSFIPFYMYLLIKTVRLTSQARPLDNYGNQFVALEERLAAQNSRFLSGDAPDSLDFLAFGIIQCHCSVYVPPVTALQTDPRLTRVRDWIAAAHLA